MSENGTGMDSPAVNTPSGAVKAEEATRKNPTQGKFKSGISKPLKPKIDINRHGIRRETSVMPKGNKKMGRKKV
mgnify:FL=1